MQKRNNLLTWALVIGTSGITFFLISNSLPLPAERIHIPEGYVRFEPEKLSENIKDARLLTTASSMTTSDCLLLGEFFYTDSALFILDSTGSTSEMQYIYANIHRGNHHTDCDLDNRDFLQTSGLDIRVQYDSTIFIPIERYISRYAMAFAYYPVYLINNNDHSVYYTSDIRDYGIQETDLGEGFTPLEYYSLIGCCTRCDFLIELKSHHCLLLLFKKYAGTELHKMRLRIQNGDAIYISETFYAYVNPEQTNVDERYSLFLSSDNIPLKDFIATHCLNAEYHPLDSLKKTSRYR